jgi:hypothetical protein
MIKTAFKVNDTAIGFKLQRELRDYMFALPRLQRYTKERIEMWASFGIPSKTKVFNFFYKDGKIIDKVMGYQGYAAKVVDRTIQSEIADPFIMEKAKKPGKSLTDMCLDSEGPNKDLSEEEWEQLYAEIREKFGASYAKRAILTTKINWYRRHENYTAFVKYSLLHLKKYTPDFNDGLTITWINVTGWEAFIHLTDKKLLMGCIPWMKKMVQHFPKCTEFTDTYANLLYKVGRKLEALEWEQRAAMLSPDDNVIQAALENMRKGEPTHVKMGAVWQ